MKNILIAKFVVLLLALFAVLLALSANGQEKPTKESRKRDTEAVEQRIIKKREEIKLKRETKLKEREAFRNKLEKENRKKHEDYLNKNS